MEYIKDPSLVLDLPLWKLDGAVIKDESAYGHSCTVTGATWGITGRAFTAVDQNINCGSTTPLDDIWDGGGSVFAWINPNSHGEAANGTFVAKMAAAGTDGWAIYLLSEAAGSSKVAFYQYWSVTQFNPTSTNTVVPNSSWTMVALTYNSDNVANDSIFYINGVTIAQSNTNPAGTRDSDAAANMMIGDRDASNTCFDGTIGAVGIYTRILTPQEILHNYLATKWRYK